MKHLVRAALATLLSVVALALVAGADAAEKVRLGKAVPFAWTFTPIDVGVEIGNFSKRGLELEVTGFAGDARLQQGLASDSVDFVLGTAPGMGFPAQAVSANADA